MLGNLAGKRYTGRNGCNAGLRVEVGTNPPSHTTALRRMPRWCEETSKTRRPKRGGAEEKALFVCTNETAAAREWTLPPPLPSSLPPQGGNRPETAQLPLEPGLKQIAPNGEPRILTRPKAPRAPSPPLPPPERKPLQKLSNPEQSCLPHNPPYAPSRRTQEFV